jgi:hypothetical protein
MKAFLVAYDVRELQKKLEIKIIKHGYVKGCPKWPAIQIWSLEILGINLSKLKTKAIFHLTIIEVAY